MDVVKELVSHLTSRLLLYWGALVGGLWAFVQLGDELYEEGGFFFDEPVLGWFYALLNPVLTDVAFALSIVGSVPAMTGLSVLVAALLWWRARQELVFFVLGMGGASILMLSTKVFLARDRPALFPDVDLWRTASPSFPSGHATGSMAFFLTLYLVTHRRLPSWRAPAAVVGVVMVLSISLSRLYLQVHYPSDIMAGWALAVAWVLAANSVYRYYRRDRTVRNVLLALPTSVVKEYRAVAEREGISEDEFVARALRHRLEGGIRPDEGGTDLEEPVEP